MTTEVAAAERWRFEAVAQKRNLGPGFIAALPQLLALLFIGAAVVFVVARMPIDGRGDYGQWLMTSRYYLGEHVPDYRTITALPPLIPFLLAATRVLIPDAGSALQVFNLILLLALVASVYLVASVVFADRAAGLFAVALAFLVTDRYLELFAFGGLLQAGALVFTLLSVAAFVQAGRDLIASRTWWTVGSLSLALAVLSHVGTGLLAVPVCLGIALITFLQSSREVAPPEQRPAGERRLRRAMSGALVIPFAVLAYWLLVLLPASVEYVTNPASLNYRGADRLVKALESYPPTMVVLVVGLGFLLLGAIRELQRRRMGPYAYLCAWTAAAWGSLAFSVLTHASTDYPRFSTPLLAPLVVAGSGGLLWLSRLLAANIQGRVPALRRVDWRLGVLAIVCLVAPLGFQKYANHVRFYQPLDAAGLVSVGAFLSDELTAGESVVSNVREGKWIEGVTGQAAVFSQPVRYTFRPNERQRSLVSDAIVKSTFALASHDFFLKFSHGASNGKQMVPRGLIVGTNHRGEFLDLLQIPASHVRVIGPAGPDATRATLLGSLPLLREQSVIGNQAVVRTTWKNDQPQSALQLTETTILHSASASFEVIEQVAAEQPVGGVELQLWPQLRTTAARVERDGQHAALTFPTTGLEQPHVRIAVVGGNGVISLGQDGVLTVRSATDRVHVEVTDLTPGQGTSNLQILDPAQLIDMYDVAAVLLIRYDPAFETRESRMEDLGYRLGLSAGAYALMVRN
jgi:hypothetical protein